MRAKIQNSLRQKVPLYDFDEHNEAFYYWHKAKYGGYIDGAIDLFHFDAHSDMDQTDMFGKSLYFPNDSRDSYLDYYRNFVKAELNISNFILPAVLGGLVRNVYFIYPKWRKFKPVKRKFNISSAFGEGRILKYGINFKKGHGQKTLSKALPDLKYFNYFAYNLDRIPKKRKVILDIDLDYFACRDSVLNNKSYELEISGEQFLNRASFLDDKTIPFSGLEFGFEEKNKRYFVKISFKKVKDIAYLPSKEKIKSEINTLVSALQAKGIVPVVITICRSSVSGYCPADYYEFVEGELRQRLMDLFNVNINADQRT